MGTAQVVIQAISYPLQDVSLPNQFKQQIVMLLGQMVYAQSVWKVHIWQPTVNANKFLFYVLLMTEEMETVPVVQQAISYRMVAAYSPHYSIRTVLDTKALTAQSADKGSLFLITLASQWTPIVLVLIIKL